MRRPLVFALPLVFAACGGPAADAPEPAPAAPTAAERAAPTSWVLDEDASRVGFGSIKAGELIESHRFTGLSGAVREGGQARLEIDLNSVATKVDIRNERMRDMFFETETYPTATLTAEVDQAEFSDLKLGERRVRELLGDLELHGETQPVVATISVTRIASDKVLVESVEPIIVTVGDYNLTEGLERLREVANLDAITPAAPVSFSLVFEAA